MPVNGGRHRQVVDETHPQPFALTHPQLGARRRRAERPGFGLVPGHQFDVQRCGDQLIVVTRVGVGHFAQPVARRAPRSDANDNKTGQATEDLATGKGHELNYLTYQRQARGLQKANTIHLRLRNSKGGAATGHSQSWPAMHLWRGSLLPLGCAAVVKPSSAISQMQSDCRICGGAELMDQIVRIEQELDGFPNTLSLYREQLKHWFSRAADKASHAADLPSLMGMERIIRFGNASTVVSSGDDDFFSTVVQCPKGGKLEIESKFESVYDIPVGNIQVDVIALESGETTLVTLDENGKGTFKGDEGKFYRIHVHNEVTPQHVEDLFSSYTGLTKELEKWLRDEWKTFKPKWSESSSVAVGNGMLAGSWAAIEGVWDGIGLLSDILKDPGKFGERLGESAAELKKLAETAPDVMEKAQLLASDEAALCLLLRTASLWLDMLPPSEIAGKTAEAVSTVVVQLLIDILIGIVLTFAAAGAGIAYLTMRLANRAAQLLSAVLRLVKAIFTIINSFISYVDRYKKVAARGIAAGMKKGRMQLNWSARRNASLKKDEHHDNVPDQAKNPNGDSADSADKTATNKCPVSMVTGEELLTLTDGALDGILPFDFTRLYRTSAAEIDIGLGFGWSHSLAHRLEIDGETVIWIDHENRRTTFPLPNSERPAIHNSLSRAAIYLGDEPEELILAQAGDDARFYHFHNGRLTTISDAYDNRLRITRDRQDRIKRLDNGAGRALRLRYDRSHLVAVDYQVFVPAQTLDEAWHTEQTLVSYSYDERDHLIEATNAAGESERYDYDDQHVILQRQLTGGASFFWEWERSGKAARCIRHWASFSQMDARYVWDDEGSCHRPEHRRQRRGLRPRRPGAAGAQGRAGRRRTPQGLRRSRSVACRARPARRRHRIPLRRSRTAYRADSAGRRTDGLRVSQRFPARAVSRQSRVEISAQRPG